MATLPLVIPSLMAFSVFSRLSQTTKEGSRVMIIVMENNTPQEQIEQISEKLKEKGFKVHLSQGVEKTIIGAIGERSQAIMEMFETQPGVEKIVPILQPFKLASREFKQQTSIVQVGDNLVGHGKMQIIAGPCAVEGRELFLEVAMMVKEAGATMLRGGAFKPRTSPTLFRVWKKGD